jgi:hypothetical protein
MPQFPSYLDYLGGPAHYGIAALAFVALVSHKEHHGLLVVTSRPSEDAKVVKLFTEVNTFRDLRINIDTFIKCSMNVVAKAALEPEEEYIAYTQLSEEKNAAMDWVNEIATNPAVNAAAFLGRFKGRIARVAAQPHVNTVP